VSFVISLLPMKTTFCFTIT